MIKILVSVTIGDNEDSKFKNTIQVEINSIDYLIIQDNMEVCSCEEFGTSWDKLVKTIENQRQVWLPREWYISEVEFLEKIYKNT